ncbi:MAG: hypothetical protein PHX51_04865, partial [Clostridia bacterium]|nr:hypothetical protein [Clostridia bacterium]
WVDLDLAVGDYSASFELFQYNHFLTNPQYADVGYYYYASNTSRTAYENYIPVNHFKLDKTLRVVASDVLDDNLYNAVINNSNITSYVGEKIDTNNSSGVAAPGVVRFSKGESIQAQSGRSYIQLAYANGRSYQTIYPYPYSTKNSYYCEYYIDGTRVAANDVAAFNDKTKGILEIKAYWYGLEASYKFTYVVEDTTKLQLDYVLNQKYTGDTLTFKLTDKPVASGTDSYTSMHWYFQNAVVSSMRTLYISDAFGKGLTYEIYQGDTKKATLAYGEYKTFEQLGLTTDNTYTGKISYAGEEMSFKFKLVDNDTNLSGRLYYLNGRSIGTTNATDSEPFIVFNGENLKIPTGKQLSGKARIAYDYLYYLSATLYPVYTSGATVKVSDYLGVFENGKFDGVKFYAYNGSEYVELTFGDELEQRYYSTSNYLEANYVHSLYYRLSTNSLSSYATDGYGKLKIEFTYKNDTYSIVQPYQVVDYMMDLVNGESYHLAHTHESTGNKLTGDAYNESGITYYQGSALSFDSDDGLYFKNSSKTADGYDYTERWYYRYLYVTRNSQDSTFSYTTTNGSTTETVNGKGYKTTSSGLESAMSTHYNYDFYKVFSKITLVSGGKETKLYDDSLSASDLKEASMNGITSGEIRFYLKDTTTCHVYPFVIENDANDAYATYAKFTKLNNYSFDNVGSAIPTYNIVDDEYVYIYSSMTQLALPSASGYGVTTVSAPYIYNSNVINVNAYNSGLIQQYYLSKTNADASLNYTLTDISSMTSNYSGSMLDTDQWTKLSNTKLMSGDTTLWSYGLDISATSSVWPSGQSSAMLCCVYTYCGQTYIAKVKLQRSSSAQVKLGVRRINNSYYYDDDNINQSVVINKNNPDIQISTSSLWHTASAAIKSLATFQSTSTYTVDLYNGETSLGTSIDCTVNDGYVKLSTVLAVNPTATRGVLKINNFKINSVIYNEIEIKFSLEELTGSISKLNGVTISDGARMFVGEKLAANSNSSFTYTKNNIVSSASFAKYNSEVTSPRFKYYYSVAESALETRTRMVDVEQTITIDGKEVTQIVQQEETYYVYVYTYIDGTTAVCEATKVGDVYYYLIPDTDNWRVQENGTLRVAYKPSATANEEYIATIAVTAVAQNGVTSPVLTALYGQVFKTDGTEVGISKLMGVGEGLRYDSPIVLDYNSENGFNRGTQFVAIPNTSHSSIRYYDAYNTPKTAYFSNSSLSIMLYDVTAEGSLPGEGINLEKGVTSLYDGKGFNTGYTLANGEVCVSNGVKAIVATYTLNGVEYSIIAYYEIIDTTKVYNG